MAFEPVIIALMGPSGSGRSNFIGKLTGNKEDSTAHRLKPHTQEIREVTVNLSDDRHYVFLDTPGFGDTNRSDRDILCMIAEWLEKRYHKEVKLTGIIYFHRITDNRMSESVCENLDMFNRLCGERAAERVRFVTTMWDNVRDAKVAESRVLHLEGNFWKPLIDRGARHEHFENTFESAWRIVRGLTGEGEAPLIQEELMDVDSESNETTADRTLYTQFQQLLHEQQEIIKQLRDEVRALKDLEMLEQLQAGQRRLEAELEQAWNEKDKLTTPFFTSAAPFFPEKPHPSGSASEVAKDYYVIFVVGPSGAGKTWFTRQLSQTYDMSRHPCTKNVEAWSCNLSNGSDLIVVDMPSFYSDRDNIYAKNRMTDWLESNFTEKCHSGVLFLHSLDSDPTHGDMLTSWHLETFAKAFPNKVTVPSHVYVVPTSHPDSTLPGEKLNQRVSKLKTITEGLNGNGECGWRASIFPGLFKGCPETAWSATLLLLKDIAEAQAKEFFTSPRPASKYMHSKCRDARVALRDLMDYLFKEFRKNARNGDLDAIITIGRITMEFTPPEHPEHPPALIYLAGLLSERFNKEGTKEDLDELVMLRRAALKSMPSDDLQRQTILRELDDCLYERFKREESMVDLDEIITLRRDALELTPLPKRCRQLLNLASALHERFQKQGSVNDINEAVNLADTASELHSPGHSDLSLSRDHASYLKAKIRARRSRAHPSSISSGIKQLINKVFFEKVETLPPRLLHTRAGILCNRDAQLFRFEQSPQYKQLLSSTSPPGSQQLEKEVHDTISEFFGFAILSHRWRSDEPLLHDIEGKKIYDLDDTDGLVKLQEFCILALERNFQWAWSDTCCIDKDSSAELQQAIGSMFSWYRQSSLTIVYLFDVSNPGSLANSVWFKRGWTLQELLASRTVLFYTHDWSLYMNRDTADHKTDPAVLEELHNTTGIERLHLTNFCPGMDDARSRLHWASRRYTTLPEDIAYSLFGIFKVHLPVLYGENAEHAIGRLLAEIISGSGDVSVLDWVGEASSFNSCFPANLVPYRAIPHAQPIPSYPARRNELDLEKARKLYNDLARLPLAGYVNRRLTLPSTIHPVTMAVLKDPSASPSGYTYEIHASRLRPVNVTLSVKLDRDPGTMYILIRPWHPKSLETQTESDDNAVWNLLEQLEQPFNALLLKRLPHNQYKRIASDRTITARVQDLACTLDSEVLHPEIV